MLMLKSTDIPFDLLDKIIACHYTARVEIVNVPVEQDIELAKAI